MDDLINTFADSASINQGRSTTSTQSRNVGQQRNPQAHPRNAISQLRTVPVRQSIPTLSEYSSSGTYDCAWASYDFLLGAGMVIIQKNTHKIVVIHETEKKYWFFPRGRKDTVESLETTALREAYEESGYHVKFLPIFNPHQQPLAKGSEDEHARGPFFVEPVYMTIIGYHARTMRNGRHKPAGQYLTTWYVGQITEDAVPESGTGMHDEQNFKSHLFTYEEAMQKVYGQEKMILQYVWLLYLETLRLQHEQDRQVGGPALDDLTEREAAEKSAEEPADTDNQAGEAPS